MPPTPANNYWDELASQFQHQQPPLRPGAEDVMLYQQAIAEWQAQRSPGELKALLLGVTPEIVNLAWPAATQLVAVERSLPMIERIWLGDIPGRRRVVQSDWFQLQLPTHSQDLVFGDGVLTALSYPEQYHQLARLLARWLKPDGRLILRVFARPTTPGRWAELLADLRAARITKFDILKWRLAMLLQPDIGTGVRLDDIYRAWLKLENDHPELLAQTGWPQLSRDTIKLYAGRRQHYTFPTVAELHAVLAPVLQPVSVTIPGYEFGAGCPFVVYAPTG